MYWSVAESATRGGTASDNGDVVVTLNQLPRWSDADQRYYVAGDLSSPMPYFSDPLTLPSEADSGGKSRFPVDHEINSQIYLWRGNPWNLEVDAVVNSTNESLDEAHSSLGLHVAAGPDLAEECASLGRCRTWMAKITNAYDLPDRNCVFVQFNYCNWMYLYNNNHNNRALSHYVGSAKLDVFILGPKSILVSQLHMLPQELLGIFWTKEYEPLIQKPYSIVYMHSAASLQVQPDLRWMKQLQQVLDQKHKKNLHVWKKVVYVDRLLQLFRYVPREQLTILDFVFQHDLEVNGGEGFIIDPRTKHIYQRTPA